MADPVKPPSFQDRMKALQGDSATPEPAAAPESATASSDPVERAVNWASENLVPEGMPEWARAVGRYTIPQNTPELALAVALSPIPGATLAKGPLKALAGKTVSGFLGRTAATAGTTAAAGAATGHDPVESGLMGAAGRVIGEPIGAAYKAVVQNKVVTKMMGRMTSRLADSFRDIIGPWLPEGATDQRVIQDVLADGPSQRVGAAINELRAKNAATPVKILDLQPELESAGVVHAWTPGATAGPGRVDPKTVKGGMVWPPVREFESTLPAGNDLVRYGAVSREGSGALARSEQGMVPFGAIDRQIETGITEIRKAVSEGIATREDLKALDTLERLRFTIASRVEDPQMLAVLKEYGRTKQLRDLLWGSTRAAANKGEDVLEKLIDPKTGNLSKDGIVAIQGRLLANAPRLQTLRPDEVVALQSAMNLDLALGGARAEAGRGLSALMPGFSWYGGGPLPHLHWGGKGPTTGSMPGWEAERSLADRALPAALKILFGTQVPAKGKEALE